MKFQKRTGALLLLLAVGTTTRVATQPFGQQAFLKASNTGGGSVSLPGDYFGYAVAVSGDTVVVGAQWEDSNATGVNGNQGNNNATNSGAVYVFGRSGTNWGQQAYLKASNTGPRDDFGWSVGVSGDTIIVGSPYEDSNATGVNGFQNNNFAADSGAAYVFVRSGTNWNQQAYLKPSNTEANDTFGRSVAVWGDTAVVGAPLERSNATGVNGDQGDNSATWSGAAYVFVRNGTNWSQQAYLKASNTGAEDGFAQKVAISGDTIVVGSPGEDSNATGVNGDQSNERAVEAGAAYVFVRNGTKWRQQAYLKASNTRSLAYFGESVAVSGDTVIAGGTGEKSSATGVNGNENDTGAFSSGAAYTFVRNGETWNQQGYLKASNTGSGDAFGNSVAVSGRTIVIGAAAEDSNAVGVDGNQNDNSATNSGAAYVFAAADLNPRLSIENSADSLRVFWPLPAAGFVLEVVDVLNASPVTGWSEVSAAFYQTNAADISVTLPLSTASKFYRLSKP